MTHVCRLTAVCLVALVCGVGTSQGQTPERRSVVIGHSVRDRPIKAVVIGDEDATHRLLIVGCIHGTERAGEAITRRLRRATPPDDVALWIIDQANPDGCLAGTRQNARGVDLNRNSPWRWKRKLDRRGGLYYPGRRPLSEPESRAINRLIRRVRPTTSIWYHQHARLVSSAVGDKPVQRRYARLVGLPLRNFGCRHGSITCWEAATYRQSNPFVVELPAGRLSADSARRHAEAVLDIAGE
jgi:protein MpaA